MLIWKKWSITHKLAMPLASALRAMRGERGAQALRASRAR